MKKKLMLHASEDEIRKIISGCYHGNSMLDEADGLTGIKYFDPEECVKALVGKIQKDDTAELARLREALEKIADYKKWALKEGISYYLQLEKVIDLATTALEDK